MKSPKKKSGGKPLLWIFLLILIGGGAYVAMEPEIVTDLVGPLLGETPEPPPPPIARKPAPPKPPVPSLPPAQPESSATSPAVPPAQPPQAAMPDPAPAQQMSAPTMATTSVPARPKPASPPAPMAPPPAAEISPPITASPTPFFGEGQRVTLLATPGAPRQKVALMRDAEGTKPGPAVPPGTAFTVLDGDLQDSGWVYYVRSDYGTKGWLEEKQLRAKR